MDRQNTSNRQLLYAAFHGDLQLVKDALAEGADIYATEPETGLSALHLAAGSNHLAVARYLIEQAGAQAGPDGFGRWPSVIAAQCRASGELCLYLAEFEPDGK